VGKTSSDLSSRASEQAAALEETTASTLELRKRANENAQMATSASQLLAEIDGEALKARTCLSEVTTGMVELREASRRIEKVIQIVDDIAFQTNILALNAAVEAARAGEAGLGFAVVAAEVRNLSHRSATAASETKGLIETTIALSSKSEGLVAGLSGLLTRVTDSAGKAKRQANAIHSASLRQDEDTRQIGEALRQLEEVSQAAASNAELCSSTSSDLTEQAEDLNLVVSQLEALH
jgi:methyl-accepting chemotaxis protein